MDDISPHKITSEISFGDFAAGEAKPEAGGHLTQQDQPLQRQNIAREPFETTLPDERGDHTDDFASSADAAFAQIETECGLISSTPRWDAHPAYTDLSDDCIRLLKILPTENDQPLSCVVREFSFGKKPSYAALSYTWGSQQGVYEIVINGRPLLVPKNLWRFLSHARAIDGDFLEWLWIDMLSINQADLAERGHQVNLMPMIYKSAKRVNVWLGPAYRGSDAAMTALSKLSTDSKRVKSSLREWAGNAGHAMDSLCRRAYWRRLWVFQELRLARDIHLICGHKLATWQQFKTMMQVSEMKLGIPRLDDNAELALESPAMRMMKLNDKDISTHLWHLVKATSHLRCADFRDKVYALLGVATSGCGTIEPHYSVTTPMLLNNLLKELYVQSPPHTLHDAAAAAGKIEEVLGVQPGTIYVLQGQRGHIDVPSEADIRACRLGPQDSRVTLWWAAFYGHEIVKKLFFDDWKCEYFANDRGFDGARTTRSDTLAARKLFRSCMMDLHDLCPSAHHALSTPGGRCAFIKEDLDRMISCGWIYSSRVPYLRWFVRMLETDRHSRDQSSWRFENVQTLQLLFAAGGYLATERNPLLEHLALMVPKVSTCDLLDADLFHELNTQRIKKKITMTLPCNFQPNEGSRLIEETNLPLLSVASYLGNAARLETLLDTGRFDINVLDNLGWTPLHYAVSHGWNNCVRLLIKTGQCHINISDKNGRTPIMHAAINGHHYRAEHLLESGICDINIFDCNGWTALMHAANEHHGQLKGAGSLPISSGSQQPKFHADILDLLAKDCSLQINVQDTQGRTQVMNAACHGSLHVCEALLSLADCNPDISDEKGWTPLILAASKSGYQNRGIGQSGRSTFRRIALLLLRSKRIDVNVKDKSGRTALMIAAAGAEIEIVAALLDFEECDVDATSDDGDTALSCAQRTILGKDIVKLLKRRIRYNPLLRQIRRVKQKI